MPLKNSPIRWDIIKEAQEFLHNIQMNTATNQAKLYFLFRDAKRQLSRNEIALILRPDRLDYDGKTGDEKPSSKSYHQTNRDIADSRHDMRTTGVVLYCIPDEKTGAQLYRNVTSLEMYEIVVKRTERIMKGMRTLRKMALEILGLTKEQRRQLMKQYGDRVLRDQLEKVKKELDEQRQKELEQIHVSKMKERERKRKKEQEEEAISTVEAVEKND